MFLHVRSFLFSFCIHRLLHGINRLIDRVNRLISGIKWLINGITRFINGITRLIHGWKTSRGPRGPGAPGPDLGRGMGRAPRLCGPHRAPWPLIGRAMLRINRVIPLINGLMQITNPLMH